MSSSPLIGITCDIDADGARHFVRPAYAEAVARAGGIPLILPPRLASIPQYLNVCDGFVFTGGDDPIMEQWGIDTHPRATEVHPDRQFFELALLDALAARADIPVLGICLGMQYMALHAGGTIDQHLPDSQPTIAARHWGKVEHEIILAPSPRGGGGVAGVSAGDSPWRGEGACVVLSHHRQAIVDPGSLEICARSVGDELIEGVCDPHRLFYVGVQWHPERTEDEAVGVGLFARLVDAARRTTNSYSSKNR